MVSGLNGESTIQGRHARSDRTPETQILRLRFGDWGCGYSSIPWSKPADFALLIGDSGESPVARLFSIVQSCLSVISDGAQVSTCRRLRLRTESPQCEVTDFTLAEG